MDLVFRPLGVLIGVVAGLIGKKLFNRVWALIDDEEAPQAKYREIPLGKLVVALILQGAIFGVIRGLADHGARHAFARLAGEWPGQERPDPE